MESFKKTPEVVKNKNQSLTRLALNVFSSWLKAKKESKLQRETSKKDSLESVGRPRARKVNIIKDSYLGYDSSYTKKEARISFGSRFKKPDESKKEYEELIRLSKSKIKVSEWKNEKTLTYLKNKERLKGVVHIPSQNVFAETHLFTEQNIESFKGKKATLHLLCPGIGGSASSRRFKGTFEKGKNQIGACIKDAIALGKRPNGKPYFLWRNLSMLSIEKRREAFSAYCTNLVMILESRLGCQINECTWSVHSGGGRLAHYLAQCFPTFRIPLKNGRTLKIKGINACDSQYEGNADGCYSILGNQITDALHSNDGMKIKRLQKKWSKTHDPKLKAQIKSSVRQLCTKQTLHLIARFLKANLYKGSSTKIDQALKSKSPCKIFNLFKSHNPTKAIQLLGLANIQLYNTGSKSIKSSMIPRVIIEGYEAISTKITQLILKGKMSEISFPKYHTSIEDNGWRHQARWNRFLLKEKSKYVRAHNIADEHPSLTSKQRHWHAWGKYSKAAIKFMSQ